MGSPDLRGGDASELYDVATHLRRAADQLDSNRSKLSLLLRGVSWNGPAAAEFHTCWQRSMGIARTSQLLRDAASDLERNAGEQRLASLPMASDPHTSVRRFDSSGGLSQFHAASSRLGDVSVTIAATAQRLTERGFDGRFLDFLTSPAFVGTVEKISAGVDIGQLLLDLTEDFETHLDIPFDDRIVHAIADAGLRLGLTAGMDTAARWLAVVIGGTVLPGVGAAAGAVLGQVIGAAVETIAGQALESLDDLADLIDVGADRIVDAFKLASGAFEAVEAVVDLADTIIDGIASVFGN